ISDKTNVEQLNSGQVGFVVLKQTPFYAESGGQVADKGIIKSETGVAQIIDVQKAPNGQHLHKIEIVEGYLSLNQEVVASVDETLRKSTVKNHTATHLLHRALKDV